MSRVEAGISGPMLDLIGEVGRQRASNERIRRLNESGLFARLLKANVGEVDIAAFEQLFGLQGPPSPLRIVRNYFPALLDLREALRLEKCYVGKWANEMLDILAMVPRAAGAKPEQKMISIVSNEWLGLPDKWTYRQVLASGAKRGLGKCIPEDALMIRLKYKKQPYGEHIRVAMEPVPNIKGNPSIFQLENTDEDGLKIDGICGDLDREWSSTGKVYWAFENVGR